MAFGQGITGTFSNTTVGLAQMTWNGVDAGFLKNSLKLTFDTEVLDFEVGTPLQFVGRTAIKYRQEFSAGLAEVSANTFAMATGIGASNIISVTSGATAVAAAVVNVGALGGSGVTGYNAIGGNLTSVIVKAPTTFSVASASDYSGTVAGTTRFTTSAAHGLSSGQHVTLSSMTVGGYDGSYAITVIDTTKFYVTLAYSATSTGTGVALYVVNTDYFVEPGGYISNGRICVISGSALATQVGSDPRINVAYSYNPGTLTRITPGVTFAFEQKDVVITHIRPNTGKFVRVTMPLCQAKGQFSMDFAEGKYMISDFTATAIPLATYTDPLGNAAPYGYVDFES